MIRSNTRVFIVRQLIHLDVNLTSFAWTYYFSVRDIVHLCKVGGVNFMDLKISKLESVWNEDVEGLVLELPMGTWTSRVVSDALEGRLFMCHTLVPNITVDFEKEGVYVGERYCQIVFA